MKNLANCKPSEFLVQTNKIRKSVSKWLEITDILNIRTKLPKYTDGMTQDERKKAITDQMQSNLNDMLDSVLDNHPAETLEILALMCFVDPAHVDDHPVYEYLEAFTDLINNKAVVDFFVSLVRLDQRTTSDAPRG